MLKEIGAICVVLGASVMGFGFAGNVRRQIRQLSAMEDAFEYLKSEIVYRRTPLPQAFELLAEASSEPAVRAFFDRCANQLAQIPNESVQVAFRIAWNQTHDLALPAAAQQTILMLGTSLGQFDLEGQERAITLALERLKTLLGRLDQKKSARCRSYATIGICAGLAVAVILL